MDSGKSTTDLEESGKAKKFYDLIGRTKVRDFLNCLADPTGFIFYQGSTRNRRYRTTRAGRSMLKVWKGEADLPDPD